MNREELTGNANNANNAKERRSGKGASGATMGVTSLIATLVILVLVIFAALTLTTARADLNLSEKTARTTSEYYAADATAEEKTAEVTRAARSGAGWSDKLGEGYAVTEEGGVSSVAFEVPIDENRALSVRLRVTADGDVGRELWQVRQTGEWTGEYDMRLMIE
jgi:biopolymer transport protein ExbD